MTLSLRNAGAMLRDDWRNPFVKAGATLIASWVLAFALGVVLCMALSGCAMTCEVTHHWQLMPLQGCRLDTGK